MQSLNSQEKEQKFKIIDSMNKKIGFKKNPRFKVYKVLITVEQVRIYNK